MTRLGSLLIGMMLTVTGFALAQEATSSGVQVLVSEEYGPYLADAQGRTLYLFVTADLEEEQAEGMDEIADTMTEGIQAAAQTCDTDECLAAWPPFTVEGVVEPTTTMAAEPAGAAVDADLLYTLDVAEEGPSQVVYNGWPLYYFARDAEPGQINGQGIESFGGKWYLVSPEGARVEGEMSN